MKREQQPIDIWTVYEKPSDFPDMFVARKFSGNDSTKVHMTSPDLEVIRDMLRERGLVCVTRHPNDDPVIVETWL